MVDWDSERVSLAFAEACRTIHALKHSRRGADAVVST